MPAALQPVGLKLASPAELLITWSDGMVRRYRVRDLRDACPCATCREKRRVVPAPGLLPIVSPHDLQPLTISSMKPVGGYAYGIDFSDGHDTGIYTYEFLRELGAEA